MWRWATDEQGGEAEPSGQAQTEGEGVTIMGLEQEQ